MATTYSTLATNLCKEYIATCVTALCTSMSFSHSNILQNGYSMFKEPLVILSQLHVHLWGGGWTYMYLYMGNKINDIKTGMAV